jgi:hypothetical protein
VIGPFQENSTMKQNQYPKTFTHRDDHMSSVVVMNADQESQLPVEYLPASTGESGQTISGADKVADLMLSPEYAALLADREKLEQDRKEFAELVANAQREAAEQAQKLADDRAELTAGYKGAMDALNADRAKLEEDQRLFDAAKAGSAPDTPPADTVGTTDAAPAAAPAKRVRTPKD